MDSYLEDSNNLRDGTFIDNTDFVASTPARPTAKSRLSEFQFSKEQVMRQLTKSLQQHENNPAADGNTSTGKNLVNLLPKKSFLWIFYGYFEQFSIHCNTFLRFL